MNEQQITAIFDRIAPKYDLLRRVLSLGQEAKWRRALIRVVADKPNGVFLDVGAGTGDLVTGVAKAKNFAKCVGVDLSAKMIEQAQSKLMTSELPAEIKARVLFTHSASYNFKFIESGSVDCAASMLSFRNIPDRANALREYYRLLKREGQILIMDVFRPTSGNFSRAVQFYLNSLVPQLGALIVDKQAMSLMPARSQSFCSVSELTDELLACGFREIRWRRVLFGAIYIIEAKKP